MRVGDAVEHLQPTRFSKLAGSTGWVKSTGDDFLVAGDHGVLVKLGVGDLRDEAGATNSN